MLRVFADGFPYTSAKCIRFFGSRDEDLVVSQARGTPT